ncbi:MULTISPECIES: site-specific integrase [unclassified Methylobacterium]|uniref:tyrosine-type recombinase/integrase n=1 Tax=unclassified Methylobacterium TaxID=2615210 RepID=UPI0011C2053F|nr:MULTISPECIES: site-specific integrase [unclassified Methylobacterium]QEE37989.1 tyrosine-type recombinase/integrase [Methylobacterium sp. WL1]TXN59829.1 tyrosine-type recombinase/integrase [Methylobacterium sp. WL2]
MRLTNAAVEALKLPPGKDRLMVYDDVVKGFGVRLSAGGSKMWFVQYRTQRGDTRRETIGKTTQITATDARKNANERLGQVRLGEDPRAKTKRAREAPTFGALIEPYLKEREGEVSVAWHKELTRFFTVNFEPLHKIVAREVTKAEIHRQLQEVKRERGLTTANRSRTALVKFYSWLLATDVVDVNVAAGTQKPGSEKTRDRVLKPDEVAAIWRACQSNEESEFSDIVRLLLLTAQRRHEVSAMVWSELDHDAALWILPGERTKNGLAHEVPLSAPALTIVSQRPEVEDRQYLFGKGKGPFSGYSRAKRALDKRSGVTEWRLHDLRRTAATMMADVLKVQPHVIEAILNHTSGSKASVAGIYNRAQYRDEKRDALDLWGRYVTGL